MRQILILAIGSVISVGLLFYFQIQAKVNFFRLEVKGIVTNIEHGERNFPNIWVDNKLIDFGTAGYTIENEIQIGDSIVKLKDNREMLIFKKTDNQTPVILKI